MSCTSLLHNVKMHGRLKRVLMVRTGWLLSHGHPSLPIRRSHNHYSLPHDTCVSHTEERELSHKRYWPTSMLLHSLPLKQIQLRFICLLWRQVARLLKILSLHMLHWLAGLHYQQVIMMYSHWVPQHCLPLRNLLHTKYSKSRLLVHLPKKLQDLYLLRMEVKHYWKYQSKYINILKIFLSWWLQIH